jgi:hypothetical protein
MRDDDGKRQHVRKHPNFAMRLLNRSRIMRILPATVSTVTSRSCAISSCVLPDATSRVTGNASFTTPVPALSAVTTAVNELQNAETTALAPTKGAVAIRNEKRTTVIALLQQLRGYVQSIADGNVENGTSIIESSGIAVRKPVVRKPRVFDAAPGAVSGAVKLVAASAGPRSSYEWEYSADGGKTWLTQPVTIQAKVGRPRTRRARA